jgi:hypothetical protein
MMFMVAIPASQIRDRSSSTLHAFSAQHNWRSSITRDYTLHIRGSESDTTSLLVYKRTQLAQGKLANVLLFLDNVGTKAIRVAYYD